jgi:hypothetical protein
MSAPTQDDLAQAEHVDWTDEHEPWSTFKLKDGTLLKVKLVLQGVLRLKKCNPDGTPIYLINTANIVRAVDVPPQLRQKPRLPPQGQTM